MLDEILIQDLTQDTEQAVNQSETTVPLEAVLWLINRFERAEMLNTPLRPRGEWILRSEVLVADLATTLHAHLSKNGWRRIVEALHWHNRQTGAPPWDISQPADFIAATELALTRWEEASKDELAMIDDWAPSLRRQVKTLMQSQLEPVGVTAWLLSPRALINRLSARARRAHSETQIESAVSEAALQTARMVGTDTERDVALKRVELLRKKLGEQLRVFCEENGLALPRAFSREEAYCLHLLNAYFVALAEAEGMIAQRGTALARRQITLEGERAKARMDGRLLPGLMDSWREINPLRESFFRERVRHKLALLVGGVFGAIVGSLWSIVESISDVLIAGVARQAVVVAPALLVGLMTLVAQTLAYSGPFTLHAITQFLARALWNGTLALGATILIYGCWLYFASRRNHMTSEARTASPVGDDTQYPSDNGDSAGF